jgi:hypothetical protein
MPVSERSEPSLRRTVRWIIPGLGILGALTLLPGSWMTALSQSQSTVPPLPQNLPAAAAVTFTFQPGCLFVVNISKNLMEGPPNGKELRVIFDPAPVPPNQAAAGSLGGGNIRPLGPPIDLGLRVRDLSTGVEEELPPELSGMMVTLHLCIPQHPTNQDTQFAWLREVRANGMFAGYFRDSADFDPAANSLVIQVPAGSLTGTLFLPSFIVPAFVANFDAETHIFSSPFEDAIDFGVAGPQFTHFKVVGPQVSERIFVFDEVSQNYGWIAASGVGPVAGP